MKLQVDVERVSLAHKAVCAELLAERAECGHWEGHLASSPLATAAAISALVAAHRPGTGDSLRDSMASDGQMVEEIVQSDLSELLCESVQWLARHQNADGGWGDCDTSESNLAATMLVQAAFRMTGVPAKYADLIARADQYIAAHGGAAGLRRSPTMNKSVVAAILAHCALAGIVPWRHVPTLAFEAAAIPKRWRRYLQLPYPRYAAPTLIAIGAAKFHHDPPRNPLTRLLRGSVRAKSLAVLESLQAADGSFLDSTPATAFVVTSLASIGCQDHPIVERGIEFLLASVRGDASWSIKSNQAITNSALALGALAECDSVGLADGQPQFVSAAIDSRTNERCLHWLLENQHATSDPLTAAPAGGWSWSDAAGALPNTMATSAVVAALAHRRANSSQASAEQIETAVRRGIPWLLDLQSADGGWQSFYNDDAGFQIESSSIDATACALRALYAWKHLAVKGPENVDRIRLAIDRGWRYLETQQNADGRFVPLWFGNEHQPNDANPVYGTAAVLRTCAALARLETSVAQRAARWLQSVQHSNGGWGPPRAPRTYSGAEKAGIRAWRSNDAMSRLCSVEETALAVTALLPLAGATKEAGRAVSLGLNWLTAAVEQDAHRRPAVIGYYPSKLWYHERLYPLVFAADAFSQALGQLALQPHEIASVGSP